MRARGIVNVDALGFFAERRLNVDWLKEAHSHDNDQPGGFDKRLGVGDKPTDGWPEEPR
jgi:hypothetical protein